MRDDYFGLVQAAMAQTGDDRLALALMASAHAFDVPAAMLARGTREEPANTARHVSWWLAGDVFGWTSHAIGVVAGRCRSAIDHGRRHVEAIIETDPVMTERVVRARSHLLNMLPNCITNRPLTNSNQQSTNNE